ncbi:hypothetical protein O6H91_Y484400 [Diphasiastrum complanatum]|nr:hypothetical protein O6H91_Y484400 [Diphasiastrum complanatum]
MMWWPSFWSIVADLLKVVQLTSSLSVASLRAALVGPPEIVVTTPASLASCLSNKTLSPASLVSLSVLVLDEADLLLSYGYEEDLKTLAPHIPRSCQCLLMSATSSEDVEKLKKLVLHNPVTLKLTEVDGQLDDSILPNSVQQYKISCKLHDKLLYMLVLLKFGLIQKKALIFVNSIDTSFRLNFFLSNLASSRRS